MSDIISLSGVSFRRDNRSILPDVSLSVSKGDFIAVTGPNGGGKTTLMKLILKLLAPTTGSVDYLCPLRFGYLPQKNMIDSRFPITLGEMVAQGLLARRDLTRSERLGMVADALGSVGLADRAGQPVGSLSGGQLQRGLFARATISRPDVLVLDEPLSYLDKQAEKVIYRLVSELSQTATIILVSHEMSVIAEMASRHIIVDRGIHDCTAHHHFIRSDCN